MLVHRNFGKMRENRKLWQGGGEGHESHLPIYQLDELSSKHAK